MSPRTRVAALASAIVVLGPLAHWVSEPAAGVPAKTAAARAGGPEITPEHAYDDDKIVATGTLGGSRGQHVALQVRSGKKWKSIGSGKTVAAGRYSIRSSRKFPADGVMSFRVVATDASGRVRAASPTTKSDVYPGGLEMVSRFAPGAVLPWNAYGYAASSTDNRYVVYGQGTDIYADIADSFVWRDTRTGKARSLPQMASVGGVTDDGRFVLHQLYVPADEHSACSCDHLGPLALYDTATGQTSTISQPAGVARFNSGVVSGDGNVVAWFCQVGESSGSVHVCAWNRSNGASAVGPEAGDSFGNVGGPLFHALGISKNGRAVAFQVGCGGTPDDAPYVTCPVVWDPTNGALEQVPPGWHSPAYSGTFYEISISPNGRYVAFRSNEQTTGQETDALWRWDRQRQQRVSVETQDPKRESGPSNTSVADTGAVVFAQYRKDLTAHPYRGESDTFLWTPRAGTVRLTNASPYVGRSAIVPGGHVAADGRSVLLQTLDELTKADKNGFEGLDLYLWRR